MDVRRSDSNPLRSISGGLAVPTLVKVGAVVIATGLAIDLVAHTVQHSIHDELLGAFPLQEQFAHLVVVVGMVLVLGGVVAEGIRSQRRPARQEGSTRNAIR